MTEPPTEGKVVIKTTQGDIDIELWPKEAPLAVRNFLQLSMEGYYDGSPIHRILADFMIQMGDPTGTGNGGSSIWGRPFKDEFHSRIKFNHRGQVAMANENKPHTNQSQFFITLGPCEWIDRKHTIFGKVTGNTIFNVLRIGTAEVDDKDRPIDPIKIKSVEVLHNPFDDIFPRDLTKVKGSHRYVDKSHDDQKEADKTKKIKAVKNLNVLSFGDDEDGEEVFVGKLHSSHDSKKKRSRDRLSSKMAPDIAEVQASLSSSKSKSAAPPSSSSSSSTGLDLGGDVGLKELSGLRRQISELNPEGDNFSNTLQGKKERLSKDKISSSGERDEDDSEDLHGMLAAEKEREMEQIIDERNNEFNRIKDEILKKRRAIQVLTGATAESHRKQEADQKLVSEVELRRQKYIKRKREYGDRSKDTFEKLMKFQAKLRTSENNNNQSDEARNGNDGADDAEEHYHGQVLEANPEDDDDMTDWNKGKLKFKKHIDDKFRGMIGGDGRFADEYEVLDSRNDRNVNKHGSSSSRSTSGSHKNRDGGERQR